MEETKKSNNFVQVKTKLLDNSIRFLILEHHDKNGNFLMLFTFYFLIQEYFYNALIDNLLKIKLPLVLRKVKKFSKTFIVFF